MERRALLQGFLALPIVGAVDGYRHNPYIDTFGSPQGRATTLKVVIDGPFAIVVQKNNRSRIRAFTPRDPDNLHKFYFLDGSEQLDSKRALNPREANRRYNFELSSDGLKTSSQRTEVDPRLASFNVNTDLWCQQDYPMTIDFPAPKRISALLPLMPVTFRNNKQEACMAVVHVLEYDVADQSKVKVAWDNGKDLRATPCATLIKRYEEACLEHGEGKNPGNELATPSCPARAKELATYFGKSDIVFFFGTGLPEGTKDLTHPLKFFNEQILASFPHLQKRLELAQVHPGEACRNQTTSPLKKTPYAEQSAPQEVSYMPDCTMGGPVVNFPAGEL